MLLVSNINMGLCLYIWSCKAVAGKVLRKENGLFHLAVLPSILVAALSIKPTKKSFSYFYNFCKRKENIVWRHLIENKIGKMTDVLYPEWSMKKKINYFKP